MQKDNALLNPYGLEQKVSNKVVSKNPVKLKTACLVLAVFADRDLSGPARDLDKLTNSWLSTVLARSAMTGRRNESLLIIDVPSSEAKRVLLIGCGSRTRVDARLFCRIAAHAAAELEKSGATEAVSCLPLIAVKHRNTAWKIRQLVQTNALQHYQFDQLKNKAEAPAVKQTRTITWIVSSKHKYTNANKAIEQAEAIVAGMCTARNLSNLPGNICTPAYLANAALTLSEAFPTLRTTVLDEPDMAELEMGALLCVSQGSSHPAKLIVVDYRQGPVQQKPVVLIGKGVTFDSGGLSIKPASAMETMKFDMCGAASVLGTLQSAALLSLPINLVGILVAVENVIGSNAVRPGDVVTSMSGKTIEVLNTDAEGRLALCDALTYATRFKPKMVIDVATLTGACVTALGKHAHGLFSNSDTLSKALTRAGRRANDRPWPLPLWKEYQSALDSKVADMANVGGSSAGAITAACFLQRFAQCRRWAHLDIAGTATRSDSDRVATGRPVPLLTQFLIDHSLASDTDKR